MNETDLFSRKKNMDLLSTHLEYPNSFRLVHRIRKVIRGYIFLLNLLTIFSFMEGTFRESSD